MMRSGSIVIRRALWSSSLSLSLACSTASPGERSVAKPGKSDDPADVCRYLGLAEDCDLCAEMGWYDDGVCDDFCLDADSADCDLVVATDAAPRLVPPPAELPEPRHWVAIGDVHGDLDAARRALRLAGAIDLDDHWIGGDLVVVQVGDQLDRGDQEQAILDLFERLADEAHAAGGAFHALLGNHETMNVDQDFRYVTEGGWADFADTEYPRDDARLADYPEHQRGRVAAFLPGGPYARLLAGHNVAMKIGSTLFVHGGLLPQHAEQGLARMNADVSAWMRGDGPRPELVTADDSPVWNREYSDDPDADDCALLAATLAAFDATTMVVAHTVQDGGITSACDGGVWRVDVGLASYYGGTAQVLYRGSDARFSVRM